ncbi:hypothetical protein [Vibrio owensii]|uniref:hypothetical protein n=1 Tax=Vibrio harveyi group TaxID=717610 RepID=UPI003CC5BB49
MGIKSYVGQVTGGFSMLKQVGQLVPTLQRIMKGYEKEEIHSALTNDEKMREIAGEVYEKLPVSMTSKFDRDWLIEEIVKNKHKLMGSKRNQKKVKRKK